MNEDVPIPIDDANSLLSRLRVIEDQPLDERATAYGSLHAELLATLEGGDARSSG